MPKKTQTILKFIKDHGGVARFSAILKAGFHPDSITVLEKKGKLEKIGRGLYKLTDTVPFSDPDLITASLQVPKGVICLVSALAFHEATLEIPKYVDIAIPKGTRANKVKYPPIRFYRFAPDAWEAGIEEHVIDGHKVKIYSLAKTVADCYKFRNKIGFDVAQEALKIAVNEKDISPTEIIKYAKICRVDKIIKPKLEIMI
jgi:predicted transcriptional regulator of viral defense system